MISMDGISEEWDFIGDIPEDDASTDQYIPPVAKASRVLPPPSIASIEFFKGRFHTSGFHSLKLQSDKE